ncbi:hypothetical protein [Hymenobacter cellulosilyticus]|uniref:Twin-arginine translocation signal domain-containing protein n=1 Tax=Hymenobacter cellulosilyticus TaxID=2932248 RepID=A0A8T9Q0I6_9BACT|nr:hypothetical protein [Hymenobacter cellulosilyticus]UOQ70535.1 hypothetical protein MUN79_17640 [Hymenobacter cellulosilyticus]
MMLNPIISRRAFLHRTALVAAGPLLAACVTGRGAAATKEYLLYIGTYGDAEQDNIFLYRVHPKLAL